MRMGKALGLALAGGGLIAVAPSAALAGEEPSTQDRLQQLERQLEELKAQLGRRPADAEPLSAQVDRYLQEQEKGSLWVDRNGKPLAKVVDSLSITGWLRVRPTWSDNFTDRDDSFNDNGFNTFWRGGLGVGANLKNKVSVYVGLDFAGTWGNTTTVIGNDTPTTPTVQEAYIDGLYSKHLNMETRLGRFELEYGDEYVFGDTEFAQASTYFDGVRVGRNFESSGFKVDGFAAKLVDGFKNPLAASPNDSVYMAGFYGDWYGFQGKSSMPGSIEPYYVWIYNGQQDPGTAAPTPRDTHTGGFRWYGERATKDRSGIGWNVNANLQYFMEMGWSTDSRVHYTLNTMKWKPQVFGQFAYASGDHDGVSGYNPLWQDPHGRFGWADQFFFSNLAVYGVGVKLSPREDYTVSLEGRSIHQARSTVALSSKQLAWEGDFVLTHRYNDNVSVEAAYSYVVLRELPGDDVQRAYVQVLVSF